MRNLKLLAVLGLMTLAACNTVDGMGEDIEAGGENLQEASHEAQH